MEETNKAEELIDTEETVQENEQKKKEHKGMTSTKNGLILRGIIGAFILYYGYTIVAEIGMTPTDERLPLYIFVGIFAVAGIWILADTVKRLIKKQYED